MITVEMFHELTLHWPQYISKGVQAPVIQSLTHVVNE